MAGPRGRRVTVGTVAARRRHRTRQRAGRPGPRGPQALRRRVRVQEAAAPGPAGRRPRPHRGRGGGARRRERLRQVDPAALHRRPAAGRRGVDRVRQGGPAPDGVPGRRRLADAVAHRRRADRRAAAAEGLGRQERRARVREALALVGLPQEVAAAKAGPAVGRAAPAGGAWPGPRWCRPRCCCATSRPAPSTCRWPPPCSTSSGGCAASSGWRCSSSPTTLRPPAWWPTGSPSCTSGGSSRSATPRSCAPSPVHPYTRALLDAVPEVGRVHVRLKGEPANPLDPADRVRLPPRAAPTGRRPRAPRPRCRSSRWTARTRAGRPARWCWPTVTPALAPEDRPMAVAEAFIPHGAPAGHGSDRQRVPGPRPDDAGRPDRLGPAGRAGPGRDLRPAARPLQPDHARPACPSRRP